MQIKTRNALTSLLMFISLALILSFGIICGVKIFFHTLTFPNINPYTLFQNFFLTKLNYHAIFCSIFLILIYAFSFFLFIDIEFEKTQSSEIIYFASFLVACLLESARLLFPINNLWDSPSNLSVFITRIVVLGKFLAPSSLLFSVIYSNFESRQYIEQNLIILYAFSFVGSIFVPLINTISNPLGVIEIGQKNLFYTIQYSFFIATIVSMFIMTEKGRNNSRLKIGFILLIFGYIVLSNSLNILMVLLGAPLLYYGTHMYLKSLHNLYLWT